MRTKPCLTSAEIKKIAAAAEAEAIKHRLQVAIAIVDDGGHPVGLMRMDGATPANVEFALAKARTAALTRRSSKAWEERLSAGLLSTLAMPVMPVQGGLPILVMGECVGAIGISGAKAAEDELLAQAGLDSVGT
jgi:glc operon protein GlcG